MNSCCSGSNHSGCSSGSGGPTGRRRHHHDHHNSQRRSNATPLTQHEFPTDGDNGDTMDVDPGEAQTPKWGGRSQPHTEQHATFTNQQIDDELGLEQDTHNANIQRFGPPPDTRSYAHLHRPTAHHRPPPPPLSTQFYSSINCESFALGT